MVLKQLFSLGLFFSSFWLFGQTESLWTPTPKTESPEIKVNTNDIQDPALYQLDLNVLKNILEKTALKNKTSQHSPVVVSFPDEEGKLQNFSVYPYSNFSPELEKKFPEINSYYGESTQGKSSKIYFSISPLGLYSMQLRWGKEAVFIDSFDLQKSIYKVYKKSKQKASSQKFICQTTSNSAQKGLSMAKILSANDSTLRTYRLALSCTGEYAQYFGGTTLNALSAINNTMTRINGIFENDFALKMVLIPNNDQLIFLNPANDPYSHSSSGASGTWSTELMNILHGNTYGVGDNDFDIGHLFGASGGGGSAGCIGCVCNNNTTYDNNEGWYWYKGQGFTSPANDIPTGDSFDLDFVAHEMGHQFGANHTFTNDAENTPAQVEPGSGSTIMGYAGITSEDVQTHSDPYFHAISIQQITDYLKSSHGSCSVNTPTGNTIPTVNAGLDYTIPKNTPFLLSAIGADADGDAITYCWEQMDVQNNDNSNPSATKTFGPTFRSYAPSIFPVRYFPNMTGLMAGNTITMGPITSTTNTAIPVEILSSTDRTLHFRSTVRDNKPNGAGNAYDDMQVTVHAAYGPLEVTSQNTIGLSYPQGSLQTVTWNVAATNNLATHVDILLSTDLGNTWTPLLANTPNDGSQTVTMPQILSNTCRLMVKASGNIFFNINTQNFSIAPSLSANNPEAMAEIILLPNPIKGDLLFLKNLKSKSDYAIFNMSGHLRQKGTLNSTFIVVKTLPPGVYLLQIGDIVKRFIKE